jgi:hypothetical protein
MSNDVAVSFDNGIGGGASQPYLRKPVPNLQQQQGRGFAAQNGPGPGLQFMNFDLASASASNAPLNHGNAYGGGSGSGYVSFEDEPPLLEELGINISQITRKMLNILNPLRLDPGLHDDPDLSGPFLFCIMFGLAQLLSGKVHFGVILGWTSVASVFLYLVFNLLAGRNGNLDLYRCVSILGYSLVPIVLFSFVAIFLPNRHMVRYIIGAITVSWCTRVSTNLITFLSPQAQDFRRLIGYPCALVYLAFSLLIIF